MLLPASLTRNAPWILSLASALVLAGVYYFQYGLGYTPCTLCHWQRVPYFAVLLLLVPFILWKSAALRPILIIAACLFFANALLAGYHMGVEWKWWSSPLTCTGGPLPADPEAALEQILNISLVRCDEIPWSFLGLSMAGWNMLIAAGLGIYASAAILSLKIVTHPRHDA